MGKLIARALGSVLLLVPAISFALGLGPITMRSSLNQPLDAEIDIHSAQPGDLDGFAVRLASDEDFARVNVERTAFLAQIQFKLRFRSDGSGFIHLTTCQAVTEPYLDFLIEARWPRGRALKEYTVLVDPPVLTAETPAPVEQSTTTPVFAAPAKPPVRQPSTKPQPVQPVRPPQPRVATQPVQPSPQPTQRETQPASRQVERETPSGDVDYGRVKRGDTLYEIARDTRPNESVSINQMMLAYLRDNPEAFVDGNINKLKAGYVLRIKDAASIDAVSSREAVSEVRRQNLAWREGRSTRLVKQQAEPEADSRVSSIRDEIAAEDEPVSERTKTADKARLKLVAPGTEDLGSGGAADEESTAKKVKEDLLLATEALDANRQEAEELDSRMAELDEQMQSMQRLIMLKDEELLALQNTAGKEPEQQAAAPEATAKPKPAEKPKAQAPEEAGVTDELLSDPVLLGLAGLLVVAVVGWLVVRRRRMQGGFEESILNVGLGAGSASPAVAGGPESAMVSDFVMSDMPGTQGDGSDVDAISEADVYLAYGRYQQAEDILRQALDKTPNQLDLHAKLLEVFHAAKNSDAFEEQAQILHEKIGGDESNNYWIDIVPLGRETCPHSSLFGGGDGHGMDESFGEVSADEEDLLDFDFNADLEETGASHATAGGDDLDEALDFDMSSLDFDMGDDDDQKPATANVARSAAAKAPAAASTHDGGLDFDLSFGEDDSSSTIEEESLSMEMDTTADIETSGSIDFGGLELESSGSASAEHDDSPIELSFDMEEETSSTSGNSMSMDFEHSAEIVQLDTGSDEIDLDGELDEDIFSNVDEVGTKLDLAKAYVDMGDSDGARSILDEVLEEGDDSQKQQAEELLAQMG
ncbi:FimV/HubP family polar landmark protein [Kaarinaea lacus]